MPYCICQTHLSWYGPDHGVACPCHPSNQPKTADWMEAPDGQLPAGIRFLTRSSPGITLLPDENWESEFDHWSSPNGCHEDCPACADAQANAPKTEYIGPDNVAGKVWKLDVGAECNLLLEFAEDVEQRRIAYLQGEHVWPEPPGYRPIVVPERAALCAAIRSLVRRAAEFEQLDRQ